MLDDSVACRARIVSQLVAAGWSPANEATAEDGATRAFREEFDAIVCDDLMTGISGTQLCRLLRADPRTASTPIVVMTASPTRRGMYWAIESGASAYIAKADCARLPAMLRQLCARPSKPSLNLPSPSSATVAARLGHLLDSALFESHLSGRIRGIAAREKSVSGLFRCLGSLLGSVLPFRWIALAVVGIGNSAHIMRRSNDETANADAAAALGTGAITLESVEEEACAAHTEDERVLKVDIEFGGERIASLAVCAVRECANSSASILSVVQSELPPVLRLVHLVDQTTRLAMSDALTGLPNRRAAMDFLEAAVASARRHETPLSIALVDVDRFKSINDRLGHGAGDVVLKQIAATMQRSVRRSDLAARWGGEEFLLAMPVTKLEAARLVSERLRVLVERTSVPLSTGQTVEVSVSLGVAQLGAESLDALLRRADEALYKAKASGRNRIEVAREHAAPELGQSFASAKLNG
ncbi:MAG: diguanylate cyclase [Myxococcales bacterium]|nr:diguanylate cyclase [Myxococcales bacterium]